MEWRPAGSVSLPLLIFPCTIKSRSSLLAPAHPGGTGKRAVKWLWWWWYGIGQAIIFSSCCFFLLSFFLFFLTYSQPSHIGCLPCFHTWCGLSANSECMSEMCCTRLAEIQDAKNRHRYLGTNAHLCRAVSSQVTHASTIGKQTC